MFNPDFKDMLSALSDAGVDFLLVGAYALAAHGHPRATGDLDIWVRADDLTFDFTLDLTVNFSLSVRLIERPLSVSHRFFSRGFVEPRP